MTVCSFKIRREYTGKTEKFLLHEILQGIFTFKFKINIIQPQSLSFVLIVLYPANISDFQHLAMWSTVRNKRKTREESHTSDIVCVGTLWLIALTNDCIGLVLYFASRIKR